MSVLAAQLPVSLLLVGSFGHVPIPETITVAKGM